MATTVGWRAVDGGHNGVSRGRLHSSAVGAAGSGRSPFPCSAMAIKEAGSSSPDLMVCHMDSGGLVFVGGRRLPDGHGNWI